MGKILDICQRGAVCLTIDELLIKLLHFKRGLRRVEGPQHKCRIMQKIWEQDEDFSLLFKNKPSSIVNCSSNSLFVFHIEKHKVSIRWKKNNSTIRMTRSKAGFYGQWWQGSRRPKSLARSVWAEVFYRAKLSRGNKPECSLDLIELAVALWECKTRRSEGNSILNLIALRVVWVACGGGK